MLRGFQAQRPYPLGPSGYLGPGHLSLRVTGCPTTSPKKLQTLPRCTCASGILSGSISSTMIVSTSWARLLELRASESKLRAPICLSLPLPPSPSLSLPLHPSLPLSLSLSLSLSLALTYSLTTRAKFEGNHEPIPTPTQTPNPPRRPHLTTLT